MRKYKFIIYLLLGITFPLDAQLFNAGPDQTVCSGTGVDLGTNQVVPSSWCITWTPADGLDNPHSARPHASPKKTTTYVATVLTDNWESISTDEVVITIGFGGIKFNPPFLNQGSTLTVQATATINPANEPITWSFDGESKGCLINSMTGVITPGSEYGTIKIKVSKTQHPECFAVENIDINEGAKDVTATDFAHQGRKAAGGVDKLYIVGESEAIITAIPNETGFQSGQPIWYYDGDVNTEVPAAGQNEIVTPPFLGNGVRKYIAGSMAAGYQPTVTVEHLSSDELVIDLGPLITKITDKLKSLNDRLKANVTKKFPQVPDLTVEVNIVQMKYKKSKAEKYNDPGWDYKYTVEAAGQLKLSGKIYYPPWTGSINASFLNFSLGTQLYIEPYFETSLSGSVVKDPSKENAGWTVLSNPIKFTTTGGVRGVFNVVGQSPNWKVTGGFSLASEVSMDAQYYLNTGKLTVKITIAPLQGNLKLTVEELVDPKRKYSFFDYTIDLFDKWSSPETEVYDFNAQQ